MCGRDGASTWKSPVCPQHNGFGLDSRPERELVAVVKNQKHTKDAKIVLFQTAHLAPRIKHESKSATRYRLSTRLAETQPEKCYKMDGKNELINKMVTSEGEITQNLFRVEQLAPLFSQRLVSLCKHRI